MFRSEKYNIFTRAQVRFNHDATELSRMELTEGVVYKLCSKLTLEAHYTYIYNRSWAAKHYRSEHRIELEVNPSFSVKEKMTMTLRNRMEFLKEQGISPIIYIFRQRIKLEFPLKDCGRITSINMSNEVFYNLSTHYFSQNRFTPLGLTLNLEKGLDIDLSLIIRDYFSSGRWRRSIVFTTELKF